MCIRLQMTEVTSEWCDLFYWVEAFRVTKYHYTK